MTLFKCYIELKFLLILVQIIDMAKVIGVGGIFFKFKNPMSMKAWYSEVLGLTTNDYGVLFRFNMPDTKEGSMQLGTFEESTDYFGSKSQQAMINFRVDDMEALLIKLEANNVKIVNEIAVYNFGKFLHIEDPEGNRIELWEAVDKEFGDEPFTQMN